MTQRTRSWIIALSALNAALVLVILVQLIIGAASDDGDDGGPSPSATSETQPTADVGGQEQSEPDGEEPVETMTPELAAPPAGALELGAFTLPSKNIVCTLEEAAATCTIANATFTPPAGEACDFRGQLVQMTENGVAMPCPGEGAQPAGDDVTVLEYGQSATAGSWACTSSERGIDCFSLADGTGFTLARAAFTSYGPGRLL